MCDSTVSTSSQDCSNLGASTSLGCNLSVSTLLSRVYRPLCNCCVCNELKFKMNETLNLTKVMRGKIICHGNIKETKLRLIHYFLFNISIEDLGIPTLFLKMALNHDICESTLLELSHDNKHYSYTHHKIDPHCYCLMKEYRDKIIALVESIIEVEGAVKADRVVEFINKSNICARYEEILYDAVKRNSIVTRDYVSIRLCDCEYK